jgi:hypothetical protein
MCARPVSAAEDTQIKSGGRGKRMARRARMILTTVRYCINTVTAPGALGVPNKSAKIGLAH